MKKRYKWGSILHIWGLKFMKLLSAEVGRPVVYLPLRGGLGLSPWESQEQTFLLCQPGLCQTLPRGPARGRPEGATRRGDLGSAASYSFRPPRIIFSSVAFVPVATGLFSDCFPLTFPRSALTPSLRSASTSQSVPPPRRTGSAGQSLSSEPLNSDTSHPMWWPPWSGSQGCFLQLRLDPFGPF